LKSGKILHGLVEQVLPGRVKFAYVIRKPGQPTRVIHTTIDQDDVDHIDQLDTRAHALLTARIHELDQAVEKQRLEKIEQKLKAAPWVLNGKEALSYRSNYFVLLSDAQRDIVGRAALRLEQIYAAYVRFLPPHRPMAPPTTILLIRSLAEYQKLLKDQGQTLLNPAFFDCARNRILCASDLERLGDQLDRLRKEEQETYKRLNAQEEEWHRLYKGRIPSELQQQLRADRQKLARAHDDNERILYKATQRLFQTLYHEAFHAYLAKFVYQPSETAVPRWLNEGLAQIFETAIVEAGELRVGHADADRLLRVKAAIREDDLVPLVDLLKSGPDQFLVAHANDQQASDRCYLASWALAFYLMFDRKLVGTPDLDEYVRALKLPGTDPVEAFQKLIGQPLPEFEKAFHEYLLRLRPDGSTASALRPR
jgi:hypothetical protein